MRLKRVHIRGFKSFADPLDLEFGHGVTAIVGPNGCGKSNISEAVRWVLGDQNARELRAIRMQDLIFNGTATRKPEAMAEVRIVIDNEKGELHLPFSEIEVSRRLFRSGESEYRINREVVRLKDVVDLFSNTGIGTNSYSLLGQGRVDGILSAKPAERREIFEEAAGVTRYRLRQDEALRKLKRTEQDLQRVNDIVGELSRQVRSLKIQANRAARYNELHSELHKYEMVRLEKIRQQLQVKIDDSQKQLTHAQELKASLEAELKRFDAELQTARGRVDQVSQALHQGENERNRIQAEVRRYDDQLSHSRQLDTELKQQHAKTRELIVTLGAEKEQLEVNLEQYRQAEDQLRKELIEVEVEEGLFVTQEEEGHRAFDTARKKAEQDASLLIQNEQKMATLRLELESVEHEEASLLERQTRIETTIHSKITEMGEIDQKFATTRTDHQETEGTHQQAEAECARLRMELQKVEEQIEQARTENEKLRAERSRLNHRLESLQELQTRHEGHEESLKKALDRRARGESPYNSIEGLMIEKIRVRAGFEDAIENALSHWLESVICPGEEEAFNLLQALKQNGSGRLRCLPRSILNRHFGNDRDKSPNHPEWARGDGAISASELVEVSEDSIALLEPVLSRTLIVPGLDELRSILPKMEEGWLIATQSGEVAIYPGLISGGKATTTGYLRRQSEIEELQKQRVALEQIWEQSETGLVALREHRKQVHEAIKVQENIIQGLVVQIAARQQELKGLAQIRERLEKDIHALRSDREQITNKREAILEKRLVLSETLETCSQSLEGLRSRRDASREEAKRLEQALHDLRATHSKHRENYIAMKKDHERCLAEINQSNQRYEQLGNRTQQLASEELALDEKLKECQERIAQSEEALKELFQQLDRAERDMAELEAGKSQEVEKLQGVEEQAAQLRGMIEAQLSVIQSVGMDHQRACLEMENLERRLAEEIRADWEKCQSVLSENPNLPESIEELSSEITALRERISKMGEINPLALVEYNEQSERLEFLTRQQHDLESAKISLLKTINEVKRTARRQFLETFEKIRQNFNRTFRKIFGGGRTDLLLLNEGDVLDTGIEIVAQLPGKKLQSITLFSGGEKSMTAIALLFAIYQVKASPFCFLDEVDAALDDANVDRFARLLTDFRQTSQFIIVTHNKHTMAAADRIYGVTMDKPGISTVISIEFENRAEYNLDPLPEPEEDPLPENNYSEMIDPTGTPEKEMENLTVDSVHEQQLVQVD